LVLRFLHGHWEEGNIMGRLKRKRPISRKKKTRKKTSQENKGPVAVEKTDVVQTRGEEKPEKKKAIVPNKDMAKPIRPTGRRSELSYWSKGVQFLREVKIELKKVTWPSRKETMASTVVVIVLVMIVSAFLGLVDVGLSSLIGLVIR
jgi:preprotein translocase subunit SecE